MGNFPAKTMSVPHRQRDITVSTRSDPSHGYVVEKELGLIVTNSRTFRRQYNGMDEKQCLEEALELSRKECKKMGGNCVLSANFDVKQFGDSGGWMCYTITGMACVAKPASTMVSNDSSTTNHNNHIPVATATVLLPNNPGQPKTAEKAHPEQWGSV